MMKISESPSVDKLSIEPVGSVNSSVYHLIVTLIKISESPSVDKLSIEPERSLNWALPLT